MQALLPGISDQVDKSAHYRTFRKRLPAHLPPLWQERLVHGARRLSHPISYIILPPRKESHQHENMKTGDGGTSAIMWYDGEYVTKCSNTKIESRYLPNAWVYGNYE